MKQRGWEFKDWQDTPTQPLHPVMVSSYGIQHVGYFLRNAHLIGQLYTHPSSSIEQ